MPIQLAMVGLVVSDMRRTLAFYRRLGLDIPADADEKRFVMHRMPSGVTIFFDTVFFPGHDPERQPAPSGSYNIALEFYAGTRAAVDGLFTELTGLGYAGRKAPWKSDGPYAAIVEDPDGNPILITAEDPSAEI
jgi:catechol 2,3-dioxygenase-like lactoylglutathione lyase family enzyme